MTDVEIIDGNPYLPGAASLAEDLDKRVMTVLRDGRHLIGVLRSFDQFLNLILDDTYERVILPGKYCDVPLGLYIVRGDNIVLMGTVDSETNDENSLLVKMTPEQLSELNESELDCRKVQWDFET